MKANPSLPTRITRLQAAKHLQCSVSSVIRYEKAELLSSHKVGPRLVRLWKSDVIAFAAPRESDEPAKPKRDKLRKLHAGSSAGSKGKQLGGANKSAVGSRLPIPVRRRKFEGLTQHL